MKQPINEITRMQQLAGVLNENQDVEEGIGKAIGTAALSAALALGSPKASAQKIPQGIEQTEKSKEIAAGYRLWHVYNEHRSKINFEQLSPKVQDAILDVDIYQDLSPEDARKIGHAAKEDPIAMDIINTSEEELKAAGIKDNEGSLEEVVNEALTKFRKNK